MASVSVLFGKSDGQIRAEQALIAAEDRLMAYHDDEATDLAFHAKRDADRIQVIVNRNRFTHEKLMAASNRNLIMTLGIGLVLFAKGSITLDGIVAVLKGLGL